MQVLHPLIWWLWVLTLAVFVIKTDSALIAAAVACALALVVSKLKSNNYWSRTFLLSVKLAFFIVLIRMGIALLIGVPMPGTVIFRIPEFPLPNWMVGIRIGGAVTSQRLTTALHEVLIIASVILLFGGASSLASPHRLIRSLPRAIFKLGVTLSVATSVLPQTVKSVSRIQSAKRLRGQDIRGLKSWRGIALPLLEESLERALDLATAMESRGYGYHGKTTKYRAQKIQLVDLVITTSALYLLLLSPLLATHFGAPALLVATLLIVALPILLVSR